MWFSAFIINFKILSVSIEIWNVVGDVDNIFVDLMTSNLGKPVPDSIIKYHHCRTSLLIFT